MPFQYADEDKLKAIRMLIDTMGDCYFVSQETGISQRTLEYWRKHYRYQVTHHIEHDLSPEEQQFQDEYRQIRDLIFKHVTTMLNYIEEKNDPSLLTTFSPSISRLVDRLSKLENMLGNTHHVIIIKHEDGQELETSELRIEWLEKRDRYNF